MPKEHVPIRIGVLSDTHGYLDPSIAGLFQGVAHILHGGDVGGLSILTELEAVAPVTAVTGNTDYGLEGYREFASVRLANRLIFVHHIVQPEAPTEALRIRIERENPDLMVFGHTHTPFCRKVDSVLFLNPGYAGKKRFGQERSVAIVEITDSGIETTFVELD